MSDTLQAEVVAADAPLIASEPAEDSTVHPVRDVMLGLVRQMADSLDAHAKAALAQVRDEINKIIG